jgi:hypothetical protein
LCGIYQNSIINGLGLLFTAVIQTGEGKLDLYHAIIVMYIIFFLNVVFWFGMYLHLFNHHSQELTGKWVGERRFIWDVKSKQTQLQMTLYLLVHASGIIVYFVWFLYIAIDGSKFGSKSSCNHQVYFVLFFASVRATVTWLRVMMIVFFAIKIPVGLFLLSLLIFAHTWADALINARKNVFDRRIPDNKLWLVRYVIGIP